MEPLIEALPSEYVKKRAALNDIIKEISIIKRKFKRDRLWIITHPMMEIELDYSIQTVLAAFFREGKKPLDWGGNIISFDNLKKTCNLSSDELWNIICYLEKKGIIRRVPSGLTLTGQGYVLLKPIMSNKQYNILTFVVVKTPTKYRVEFSIPTYLPDWMQEFLREVVDKTKASKTSENPVTIYYDTLENVLELFFDLISYR